jgi:predicted  nucleic acid-binding Zn-ribbon protein
MGRTIEPAVMHRVRAGAKSAPSGKRLADRAQRPLRYSDEAFRWAVRGPKDLLAVAEDAQRLEVEERNVRKRIDGAHQDRDRVEATLLAQVDDHPALKRAVEEALVEDAPSNHLEAAAHAVAQAEKLANLRRELEGLKPRLEPSLHQEAEAIIAAASTDIGQLAAAIAAVELAQEVVDLQEQVARIRKRLEKSPTSLATKKRSLGARTAELEAEVQGLRQVLDSHRQQAVQISAEEEHLEHAIATSAATLRDLVNEAKVVTGQIEEREPAAARRIYHLFREAGNYREHRREAEEAQAQAAELAEEHGGLIAQHNDLVDDFNDRGALVSQLQDENTYLQDRLRELDETNDDLLNQVGALHVEVDTVRSKLWEASARARPVSELPARLAQALSSAGLHTFGQLADSSEGDLLKVYGVASAGIRTIERALANEGLSLRDSWELE